VDTTRIRDPGSGESGRSRSQPPRSQVPIPPIFESVPRYHRLPRSALRAQLRAAALQILAAGCRISVQRLRALGVRGGTAALIALREELVASGRLPPEAAAHPYTRRLHPPGKAAIPPPEPKPPRPLTGDRRSRRLIRAYDRAARRIFGRERARRIGAA
jgi:hypothetical protein